MNQWYGHQHGNPKKQMVRFLFLFFFLLRMTKFIIYIWRIEHKIDRMVFFFLHIIFFSFQIHLFLLGSLCFFLLLFLPFFLFGSVCQFVLLFCTVIQLYYYYYYMSQTAFHQSITHHFHLYIYIYIISLKL